MRTCFQFQNQSVLQHGESVHNWFLQLYAWLKDGNPLSAAWRPPSWLTEANRALLYSRLLPLDMLRMYQVYHDCGKPHCRRLDASGQHHFPDHAAVSAATWLQAGGDTEIAELIRRDMDVHTASAEDMRALSASPYPVSLLCTALAEIHSNAQMFGGIESDSFRIKFKHLDRRGKQLVKLLGGSF